MIDEFTISTLAVVAAWLAARGTLARLASRRFRATGASLIARHLAHWRYAPNEWQRYCERLRHELWFGFLRPAWSYAGPVLIFVGALAVVLERRSGLAPGLMGAITLANALVIVWVLVGPVLHEYVKLSRRRRLDYEIYIGEMGVLELWRQGNLIHSMEEHLYNIDGGAIKRVKADGATPAQLVFEAIVPGSAGAMNVEERFLVPDGRLTEARAIARRLTVAGK